MHFFNKREVINNGWIFYGIALKEAWKAYQKKEVPVGAVVVLNNKIIGRGYNLRETTNDITKHAELIAIKKACHKINDWRLNDCVLYVTLFPCPMCASAIVQSRIPKVVVGTIPNDSKNVTISESIFDKNTIIVKGILEAETKNIIQNFFKEQREK